MGEAKWKEEASVNPSTPPSLPTSHLWEADPEKWFLSISKWIPRKSGDSTSAAITKDTGGWRPTHGRLKIAPTHAADPDPRDDHVTKVRQPPPPHSPWSWPLSGDRRRSASAPIRPRTCENVRFLEPFSIEGLRLVLFHYTFHDLCQCTFRFPGHPPTQFRPFSSLKRTLKVIWSLSYSLKHEIFLQKVYYILFAFLCLTVYQQPSF